MDKLCLEYDLDNIINNYVNHSISQDITDRILNRENIVDVGQRKVIVKLFLIDKKDDNKKFNKK